jgi:FtsP/CotA-like multicopper oxidase with cupredoxin domain
LNGNPGNPSIHPYAIPEFFGDVICVNGKSWPYLNVEPRRYRFRFLNGSNARMFALRLADKFGNPIVAKPAIWQIGSDGGLFDRPVNIDTFVPFTFDPTAKLGVKNDGFGYPEGGGYVWHCHIIDHEDNNMMRPLALRNKPQR